MTESFAPRPDEFTHGPPERQAQSSFDASLLDTASLKQAVAEPLLTRVERQVEHDPLLIAVRTDALTLTYGELNRAANRLAHVLLARRGAGNETIPFLLERGALPIVALLGILKAGKTYVCLEPSNATQRIKIILADAQAGLLVTNNRNLDLAESVAGRQQEIVNLDQLAPGLLDHNPSLTIPADTPAVLLYTSGSTGQPKAAIHSHRTLLRNALVWLHSLGVTAADRQAVPFAYSFSWPTAHTFASFMAGATFYPDNFTRLGAADLCAWLARERITILHTTPSLLRQFMQSLPADYDGRFPDLRMVSCSGETLFPKDVERWQRCFEPNCQMALGYGASEASGIALSLITRDTRIEGEYVPVGRPRPGYEVLILDEEGKDLPTGQVGEIAIRSAFVSQGYWRRPELTDTVFKPDPLDPGKRVYLTGDLGRLRPDGQLEHLGRRDLQVKIRGYRVQLGEVEAALFATGLVKEVAVAAQTDARGENRLVAYVVPSGESAASVNRLRAALDRHLPDYMFPSAFVFLDTMPVNANGKIDRPNLPEPGPSRPDLDCAFVAPRDAIELHLVRLWEDLLGLRGIGIHDDFFALGGHSLLAARLVGQIEKECGQPFPGHGVRGAHHRQSGGRVPWQQPGSRLGVALGATGRRRAATAILVARRRVLALLVSELAAPFGPRPAGLRCRGAGNGWPATRLRPRRGHGRPLHKGDPRPATPGTLLRLRPLRLGRLGLRGGPPTARRRPEGGPAGALRFPHPGHSPPLPSPAAGRRLDHGLLAPPLGGEGKIPAPAHR